MKRIALALMLALLASVALPVPVSHISISPSFAMSESEDEEWTREIEEEEAEEEEEVEEEEIESAGEASPAGKSSQIVLPRDCVIRTARPTIVANPPKSRLRLAIRYTAESPSRKVRLEYWLKGEKGAHQLGRAIRILRAHGTLRMSHHLDSEDTPKVKAARVFMVRLTVPNVDRRCSPHLTIRLGKRHPHGARITWTG